MATRFTGAIGGVVGLASLSLLLFWLYLRNRSRGTLPYDTTRPLSHRTLSTRSRGSYYPPSGPIYNYIPEMNKSGWHVPEVYVRFPSRICSRPVTRRLPFFVSPGTE